MLIVEKHINKESDFVLKYMICITVLGKTFTIIYCVRFRY